jgi:hypothetical protein
VKWKFSTQHMFIFTNIINVNLTSYTLKVYTHVKHNQNKCTNGYIMLAMVLLTNNILGNCSEQNKFVRQNSMQSMPTLTSPSKDTLSYWGTYWKCIHFYMLIDKCTDFTPPSITLYLQIPYIAITRVLSKMLRNVSRGANVPPLMCNWFEG